MSSTHNELAQLPTLSVIMVVRNAAATIARALDSLAAQHYPKLELIVWDGKSTDGTLQVLARYSSLITTLKSEADNSSPDGCNKALPLATGDYAGFLYADDEYAPGTLWAVAEAIRVQPACDVISFGMLFQKQERSGKMRVGGYYADALQLELTLENILSDLPTFVLSRFYKRGIFGPLNLQFPYANDREQIARLALRELANAIIPKALYEFTMHEQSLSNNPVNHARIIKEHVQIANALLGDASLNDAQRSTVKHWQQRQFVIGCFKALLHGDWKHAHIFARQGMELGAGNFIFQSIYVPLFKLVKRLGLGISGGIDRGAV